MTLSWAYPDELSSSCIKAVKARLLRLMVMGFVQDRRLKAIWRNLNGILPEGRGGCSASRRGGIVLPAPDGVGNRGVDYLIDAGIRGEVGTVVLVAVDFHTPARAAFRPGGDDAGVFRVAAGDGQDNAVADDQGRGG